MKSMSACFRPDCRGEPGVVSGSGKDTDTSESDFPGGDPFPSGLSFPISGDDSSLVTQWRTDCLLDPTDLVVRSSLEPVLEGVLDFFPKDDSLNS